jgi:hypothetical protein
MRNRSLPKQPAYRFHLVEKYPHITIIHQRMEDGSLWATSGRQVLFRQNGRWESFASFPFCMPRDFLAFSRPTSRAARSDKCNLAINSRGRVMGIRGGMVYELQEAKAARPLFSIQGDCVLHRSFGEDRQGWTYFGEYFMNPERRPVRIWRVSPGLNEWEIAHEFSAAQVRHVHGVYSDPFEKETFWATVGDFAGECFLLKTIDRFKTFQHFGDGSQDFRAVNLFFTKDSISWLTDSNLQLNHAFRLDRHTANVEKGQELDASVWYGGPTREGLYLAFTTIERGPAIRSQSSAILVSEDAFHWQKVFEFKKDFYKPVQLFKYGVISCPAGEISLDEFYLSGEGLMGLDGSSIQAAIERI